MLMSEFSSVTNTANSLQLNNLTQWQQKSNKQLTVNGYYRCGSKAGKRIHLLHGNGFSAMTLAAMASQLSTDSNIWLTDIPGHGMSTQPTNRMPNWQKLANTVADAIYKQADVKNNGPLIGIGHSMGAILTLLAAVKYPDLFSEIILLDPVLFNRKIIFIQHLMQLTGTWRNRSMVKSVNNRTSKWQNVDEMIADIAQKPFYGPWHQQVITDFCQSASTLSNDNAVELACSPQWEASIFGSCPKGLWRAIRKINLPVNMVIAKNTYFFIPSAAKRAAKMNKNIQWQEFGEHHCFPMEQPIETAEMLTKLMMSN